MVILTLFIMSVNCFALTPANLTGNTTSVSGGVSKITEVGNNIIGVLQTVGIVVSVIILIVLGLKYMMGSAEEKAEYKKTMIPYIVGAALIFAASVLAQVVYQFFTGI